MRGASTTGTYTIRTSIVGIPGLGSSVNMDSKQIGNIGFVLAPNATSRSSMTSMHTEQGRGGAGTGVGVGRGMDMERDSRRKSDPAPALRPINRIAIEVNSEPSSESSPGSCSSPHTFRSNRGEKSFRNRGDEGEGDREGEGDDKMKKKGMIDAALNDK